MSQDVEKDADAAIGSGSALEEMVSIEGVENYPEMVGASRRDKVVMAAYVSGISQLDIARVMGVSQPMVWKIIQKHDPERKYAVGKEAKRAFRMRLLESKAVSALLHVTEEKLEKESAAGAAGIAVKLMSMLNDMDRSKHRESGPSRLERIMGEMEADVSVGEPPYGEEGSGGGEN